MLILITFLCALASSMVLLLAETSSAEVAAPVSKGDYVVLLHGLGRTAVSMSRLRSFLGKQGYQVINVTYPSTRFLVEYLSDVWLQCLLEKQILDPKARVHFVTHSLGGIIVRQYLSKHSMENLGRVVMLAPPNHGSEIIDRLTANCFTRNLLGSSRLELGTGYDAVPSRLGAAHFDCGVIAGDRSINPFLSAMLTGPNDGKVTVESAKLEGMRDFLVLHSTHTWMMWWGRTLYQILHFLESGHFDHQRGNKSNTPTRLL